jgi:hypothetical protein
VVGGGDGAACSTVLIGVLVSERGDLDDPSVGLGVMSPPRRQPPTGGSVFASVQAT